MMTDRDRILATFQKKSLDRIVWQPRLEHWYDYNKTIGTLPEKYQDKKLYFEIYDDLDASVRYYKSLLRLRYRKMKVTTKKTSPEATIITESPVGTLTERIHYAEHGTSCHRSEFPIKTVADFEIMKHILADEVVEFDYQL